MGNFISFDQWITVFTVIANQLIGLPHSLMEEDYYVIILCYFVIVVASVTRGSLLDIKVTSINFVLNTCR